MSALRTRAGEYLAMRRALGFGLATQGRHLMSFVAFCEERGAGTVTTDLAVEWATRPGRRGQDLHEAYQARKLDTVRIFARHLQALDPAAEVPPLDVPSRRRLRIRPYLYTQQEIGALMTAVGDLAPAFRGRTWQALIGLLAVTGMRQGEACCLARGDVDLAAGTVTIRDSKFGKSRMVFLHRSAATRNARLAAIRSMFGYAAPRCPEHAAVISQVLAISPRRRERAIVSYLTDEEAGALIAAPDRATWHGRRDHALLVLAVQAGLRVSELTWLARQDVETGPGAHVRCHGKGRKDRATPLTPLTAKVMRTWLAELPRDPARPAFPTRPGGRMSRDAVEKLVARHAAAAAASCPSIKEKAISPHVLRHYVDGRVMWPAASSALVAAPRGLVPAT